MGHEPIAAGRGDPRDMLQIDSLLSDEERLIRDTVRDFVSDRVTPFVAEWYRAGALPTDLILEMAHLGLLGMHVEGYGCAGASAVSYGLASAELEAGDTGARSFVSVQGSLVMYPIRVYGSEEQRVRWLPPLAAGEAIGCFGLTETDAGSDPSRMRTVARRDGSDWVLNGSKMWITNGSIADVAVVWARTDEGIRGFLVPTAARGFSATRIPGKLGLRASDTSELVLDDVRLPSDAVLPGVVGMRGPLSCLNEARFGVLFGAVGAARSCYEAALDYAGTREQFGKPIAAFQLTQRTLVDMMVQVNRGMVLALHIGRLKDAGTVGAEQISLGKYDNVRMAREVAREARGVLGANGITLDYPVMRHLTNLEAVYTYEGTNEIHTLILGQALTGISAFG